MVQMLLEQVQQHLAKVDLLLVPVLQLEVLVAVRQGLLLQLVVECEHTEEVLQVQALPLVEVEVLQAQAVLQVVVVVVLQDPVLLLVEEAAVQQDPVLQVAQETDWP